jgi:hypothetical protein
MNEETRKLLRSLVNSAQWKALISIAEETTVGIRSESVLKETPDETFKEVYLQEGQVRGIKRFIDNIFNTIQ